MYKSVRRKPTPLADILQEMSLEEFLLKEEEEGEEQEKNLLWFHGDITRETAVHILQENGNTEGLFLVRESASVPDDFVVSIIHNSQPYHFQIHCVGDFFYQMPSGPVFPGLDGLVNFYREGANGLLTRFVEFCKGKLPPVRSRQRGRTTPLQRAVLDENLALVSRILQSEHCGPLDARGASGRTALHDATRMGSVPVVEKLLEAGANVNCKDGDCVTPLYAACVHDILPVCTLLLKQGADPTLRHPRTGKVPLHEAAARGHTKCAQELLRFGAPCHPCTWDNETPLDLARRYKHECILPEPRASQEIMYKSVRPKLTPFADILEEFLLKQEAEVVLLKEKVEAEEQEKNLWFHGDITRETAVHILQENGNTEGLFLVRESASVPGDFVVSIIHNSQPYHFQIHCVGDFFYQMPNGPVFPGLDGLVNFYREGANGLLTRFVEFCKGKLPPVRSRQRGRTTPLQRAVLDKNLALVSRILQSGHCGPLDARGASGRTALHDATWMGSVPVVEKLLEAGANVNCKDGDCVTPLYTACVHDILPVCTLLLKQGANPTLRHPRTGKVPLHEAAARGHTKCAQELLKFGAPCHPRTRDNETPLDLARRYKHYETVKVLESYRPPCPRTIRGYWDHGTMDWNKAAEVLQRHGAMDGQFLVRSFFVLSVSASGSIHNFEINKKDDRFFVGDGPYFDTLEHLVDYYIHHRSGLPTRLQHPISPRGNLTTQHPEKRDNHHRNNPAEESERDGGRHPSPNPAGIQRTACPHDVLFGLPKGVGRPPPESSSPFTPNSNYGPREEQDYMCENIPKISMRNGAMETTLDTKPVIPLTPPAQRARSCSPAREKATIVHRRSRSVSPRPGGSSRFTFREPQQQQQQQHQKLLQATANGDKKKV